MVNLPVAGPMPANPNPNPNAPNPPSGGTAATAGAPASGGSTTLNPGAATVPNVPNVPNAPSGNFSNALGPGNEIYCERLVTDPVTGLFLPCLYTPM
jgi:hypothetical protein